MLAGQIDWAASPAVGFPPARARLTCRFGTSDWQDLGTDGRFVGTLDTTRCLNGADQISLTVEWTDPFGVTHSWTSPRLSATIANTPSAAWIRGPGYLSPNLGGHEDVTALGYTPIAVSYTHLVRFSPGGRTGGSSRRPPTAGLADQPWRGQHPRSRTRSQRVSAPVSYTHLDVYKRQAPFDVTTPPSWRTRCPA